MCSICGINIKKGSVNTIMSSANGNESAVSSIMISDDGDDDDDNIDDNNVDDDDDNQIKVHLIHILPFEVVCYRSHITRSLTKVATIEKTNESDLCRFSICKTAEKAGRSETVFMIFSLWLTFLLRLYFIKCANRFDNK